MIRVSITSVVAWWMDKFRILPVALFRVKRHAVVSSAVSDS
jgi:hypothetical protein